MNKIKTDFLSIVSNVLFQICSVSKQCSCQFGADGELPMAASESDGRHVGIAAASGALGSMVLAGGGLALWRCIKNKVSPKFDNLYGRPPSAASSTGSWMEDKVKDSPSLRDQPKRGFNTLPSPDVDAFRGDDVRSQMTSSKQRNIYRMGRVWT